MGDKASASQRVTHSDFVRRALAAFPELADDLESVSDMPKLQGSIVGDRLQRAKGAADWFAYERGIKLVAELLPHADADLEEALTWELLSTLRFDGPRGPTAWHYLTPELQRIWTATNKRLAALTPSPPKGTIPKKKSR